MINRGKGVVIIWVRDRNYLVESKNLAKSVMEDGFHIQCIDMCAQEPVEIYDTREPMRKLSMRAGDRYNNICINPDPRA